jgi:N-acetyl-anhydromuramyl-L-alanine amidase AmpD
MRQIKNIVVHCTATPVDMDIGVAEVRRWHTEPSPHGNGWSDVGYHFVIRRDGTIEHGRPINREGAHVKGHNLYSIGIALVGPGGSVDNFTDAQFNSLDWLIRLWPRSTVCGHRDLDPSKDCPGFDVLALEAF